MFSDHQGFEGKRLPSQKVGPKVIKWIDKIL